MGPTILTIPSVLKRIFEEADRKLEDYLTLIPLDPQWRSFFEDGTALDLLADTQKMCENLRQYANSSATVDAMRGSCRCPRACMKSPIAFFFWRSIGGLTDNLSSWRHVRFGRAPRCDEAAHGPIGGIVVRKHVPDPRVAQMIDHFTQYVGSATRCLARGAMRHCSHADQRRCLVPARRHACGTLGPDKTRDRIGR